MPARCPHCGKILTDAEVRSIHSQMIGSRPKPTSAENGKKGGRPRKNLSGPMPSEKEPVLDYASERELDEADAYNCWYVTVKERGGCDADGNPVNDWKSFVKKWCATADKNRKRNKGNQQ